MSDKILNGVPRELLERIDSQMISEGMAPDDELRALLTAQPQDSADPWAPSGADYDRSIHHNPDAKAWADFFVAKFPGLSDKHDLMFSWFANAMMAMHDWIKSQASAAQSARGGEREAFEAKYEQAKAVAFDAEHNRYVPRNDTHWQRQCAEAMTQVWRAFQAGAACVGCQAAPAGEREAFEQRWAMRAADDEGNPGAKPLRSEVEPLRYRGSAAQGSWVWFQRGAAWQRTQAAGVAAAQAKPTGVPEGWQIAPTKDGDGFIVSSPRINGVASHTAVFSNDSDPAHKLLWHVLAGAPAQPAVQDQPEVQRLRELVNEAFEFINKSCEHDSACEVFDLDDEDQHKECNCGLEAIIRKLYAAPKPAPAQDVAGWIPVTERLPEVAQEVIVSTEFEGVCAGILDSYGEWFAPCSEYKLTRVTHWMPLPAAPAHDKQSGEVRL